MPSVERENSQDRELVRHSHSFSMDGRPSISIPMYVLSLLSEHRTSSDMPLTSRLRSSRWDSSDPERAPPPLPLNPGSPSLTTRHGTSAAIALAAKALEEKARESMPMSSYTTNPMPQRSPERSLIKGATHKRMQSLQPSGVRDLRSYLDTHRSPERSPERPTTRSGTPPRDPGSRDYFGGDLSPPRIGTPTPSSRDGLKDTPSLRPSSRPPPKAILGENTPPSATMMALQTMTIPPHILDPPLSNITNSSKTPPPPAPQNFDAISNQLLSITTIVSNLQKDMTQLSRRSKDNASDLVELKSATTKRDEDIRQSLKDLVATMAHVHQPAGSPNDLGRSQSSMSLKDPHMTPTKQFTIPRLASPGSFLDERIGSPNPYSVEGAASVAMLEKIIREMVTKDGQERLINNLQKIVDHANGETAKKVSELVEFVKQSSGNNGLMASPGGPAAFQPSPGSGPLTRTTQEGFPLHKVANGGKPYTSPKAADFVSEEMLKFLRKIKDSVAESGCVTMGTKAMIQDLRGEVLGMGRELARKIEEVEQEKAQQCPEETVQTREEVSRIVQDGLADLKEHMDKVMRERRRQSISSTVTRTTVDNNEVYDVVKHVLAERGLDKASPQTPAIDQEAIVAAVREAYEAYKPNIEVQQFGLERDEVLECLREGLQDYRSSGGVTKEDIEHIVQDSLQVVKLPPPINEAHEIRDEVLLAVRECLDELRPTLAIQPGPTDSLSRETIFEVVKEALSSHDFSPGTLDIDFPPEPFHAAIKSALESSGTLTLGSNDVVMERLQSLLDEMHSQFKAYSSANGRDTEQVLDAVRDGLDHLRSQLQEYIEKNQSTPHQDEFVQILRPELEHLRADFQTYLSESSRGEEPSAQAETVAYIKSEFEHLLEQLSERCSMTEAHKNEILEALTHGFEGMKSQVVSRSEDSESNDEINEAMKQEFEQLKDVILGDTANHKDEVLGKLQAGFDELQARLAESSSPTGTNDEVLATLKEEFEHLRETLGGTLIKVGGATDKDDIIDAVRELIEGLQSSQDNASGEKIASIQGDLEDLKQSLGHALVRTEDTAESGELLNALKADLEDIKANSKATGVNEELVEALRGELEQIRESNGLTRQHARADTEEVLEAVRLGLDDLRSHLEKKLDNPDRHMSAAGDVLDALNDGLEGLRADVVKAADKPVDMTVSYEILDTLKSGLAGIREDIEKLKGKTDFSDSDDEPILTGNEVVLAEAPEEVHVEPTSREIVSESLHRNDLERMELMLSQLQVKIEAMDANIQTPPPPPSFEPVPVPGTAMKEDLMNVEELLKEIQAAVLVLQEREPSAPPAPQLEGVAMKEDTDAIEILLGNMKAKIEEIPLSTPETLVTKENMDEIELIVRTTSEAIEALSKKIEEDGASKADVTVVQVIADDIKVALDEMKAAKPDDEDDPKATKSDVDAVTLLVDEVKTKLDEFKIPDPDTLPTKAEIDILTDLVHDFRSSHDKMKETYEEDLKKTAFAFDDRKKEAEGLFENFSEVKLMLDDIKEEMKTNLAEGGPIDALKVSFTNLEDNINTNFNVTADVKELMETVSREFERAHGSIEALQNDQAEKSALNLEKNDEMKEAIINNLVEKIDARFDTLMAKYDDAQLLADEQAKVMKEKAEAQEQILEGTKAMAEELRLTIDTLGASITGINDRFEEVSTKLATDSSTMTGKLEEAMTRFDDQKLEDKTEHSHTRDELKNIENIFNGLQDNVTEYHPKFMVALREIEALVKAHYEHSQKTKEEAEQHARSVNEIEALVKAHYEHSQKTKEEAEQYTRSVNEIETLVKAHYEHAQRAKEEAEQHARALSDETRARAEELQRHFASLPALLPPPPPTIELPEKYDDGQVQEKLDKLLEGVDEATKSATQLERLDEIHAQVKATAAEISEFVAKQTQLITDGNESKEREADELALLVERRTTQKELLETDIEELKAEKERLIQQMAEEKERVMSELREEKEHEKERLIEQMNEEKERAMAELKEEKEREKERLVQQMKEEKERAMAELEEEKERTMHELKEEKNSILAVVATLQAERENLANQKVRLTGEVSSLHTALEIRREELHLMDAKADALERRILNGIMDHSRALMMAKGAQKSPTKPKKRVSTDLSAENKLLAPPSTAASGLSLALKPRSAIRRNGPQNPASRRIHSLSQISGNTPTGAQAYPTNTTVLSNASGLKRSHSVKTNYLRKSSWGSKSSAVNANKENQVLKEEDEIVAEQLDLLDTKSIVEEDHDDIESQTGTERRHSIGTGSYAESYADGETPGFDGRSSFGGAGSEYTYASESSYMTGSDVDRRTSFGSTARSAGHHDTETIDERSDEGSSQHEHSDEEEDEPTTTIAKIEGPAPSDVTASEVTASEVSIDDDAMPTDSEVNRAVEAVKAELVQAAVYTVPSDSGVGSDLPTAAFDNESALDADYFRRAAEEESTVG